jgi:hypothetical protein
MRSWAGALGACCLTLCVAPVFPWPTAVSPYSRAQTRCDCPKNRTGVDCGAIADGHTLKLRCTRTLYPSVKECVTSELACLNNCNKRGVCVSGWCHCRPGTRGMSAACRGCTARRMLAQHRPQPPLLYAGRYGADCSLSLGADGRPVLLEGSGYATRTKRPWVYVYELPPSLLSW